MPPTKRSSSEQGESRGLMPPFHTRGLERQRPAWVRREGKREVSGSQSSERPPGTLGPVREGAAGSTGDGVTEVELLFLARNVLRAGLCGLGASHRGSGRASEPLCATLGSLSSMHSEGCNCSCQGAGSSGKTETKTQTESFAKRFVSTMKGEGKVWKDVRTLLGEGIPEMRSWLPSIN